MPGAGCKILFVCHGNICRSPMAEFVMKELLRREGMCGVTVESAALHTDAIGCNIHSGTRRKLEERGIPFAPRKAWLLTAEKAREYDIILGMDSYNMADLKRLVRPEDESRLRRLSAFAGTGRDIADPWYTGDFEETYRDILAGCRGLLARLKERFAADSGASDAPPPSSAENASVMQGRWGEDAAAAHLEAKGWKIIGRNVRPCPKDRRCEIDIVASPDGGETAVFVEVKTHAARSGWQNRLSGVDARKKNNLLRACTNWVARNKWHGAFRFDVVEVWGSEKSGIPPEIDHLEDVPLFGRNWRFW